MLARRFLWVVVGIVILVLAAMLTYALFQRQIFKAALVPTVSFQEAPQSKALDYSDRALWIARPDIPGNPALWMPKNFQDQPASPTSTKASVFFIHPTSYLDRSHWIAPLDDQDSQQRARLFVRSQASAFNGIGSVWAPKYRQATFGAFLTSKEDAAKALDFAYRDVLAAFDAFVKQAPANSPIILAGHSQGSLHLTRLLRDRIAGRPIARRIVAAYVIGWPISTTADLGLLGLPACEAAAQSGCILSWQSFAEPADPKMITDVYDASVAPNGTRRAGSPMLCVNPLTGARGGSAPAEANLGTIIPNAELTEGDLRPRLVPARCDVSGFLLIGKDVPDLPAYVLPGNNYHVFDYSLFWANIRADAAARLKTYLGR